MNDIPVMSVSCMFNKTGKRSLSMDIDNILIRESTGREETEILTVEKSAFDTEAEANLTKELLHDPTAKPMVSLLAFDGERAVGHILFTKARIEGWHETDYVHLLAPMAVSPEYQNQGIGGKLIEHGLKKLKEMGTEMVFVLGDPEYYRRHGFVPEAASFGFKPPFELPKRFSEAWIVQALTLKGLSSNVGKLVCADAINKKEYWVE